MSKPNIADDPRVTAAALLLLADWLADVARALGDEPPRYAVGASAARSTMRTDASLTPREMEVVEGIARGLTNREIAHELVIATSTVERHVANILGKLGLRSRAQIAARAAELGSP